MSYSSTDKKNAYELYDIFTKIYKFKVWIDKFENDACNRSSKKTLQGILKSKCFISIITKNYIDGETCLNEFKVAKCLHKKILFVMLDDVKFEGCTFIGYHSISIQRYNLANSRNALNYISEFKELIKDLMTIVCDERFVSLTAFN